MIKKIKSFVKSILPPPIAMPLKEIISAPLIFESLKRDLNSLLISRPLNEKNISKVEIFKNAEFKIYSQNGEDGIIQYIFSKIGTTNKIFVEFGIEDGRECNTANLIINNGWNGLLMDGNKKCVSEANYYYNNKISVSPNQVKIINCFITKENINKVILKNGINGEIDLLSIDIDGNDYWIWEAINSINPRLVVIEYNSSLGDDKSISVKYDKYFERHKKHKSGCYYGASLIALTKLAKKKGYILVGCDSTGCNAFFIRNDIAKKFKFPEISIKEAYYPMLRRLKNETTKEQFNRIKNMEFVEM